MNTFMIGLVAGLISAIAVVSIQAWFTRIMKRLENNFKASEKYINNEAFLHPAIGMLDEEKADGFVKDWIQAYKQMQPTYIHHHTMKARQEAPWWVKLVWFIIPPKDGGYPWRKKLREHDQSHLQRDYHTYGPDGPQLPTLKDYQQGKYGYSYDYDSEKDILWRVCNKTGERTR